MSTNNIIATIEKLFRLANDKSATLGEIETAQRLAQELITKHQISQAQLRDGSDGSDITSKMIDIGSKHSSYLSILLNVIAKHNFCKVLRGDDYCIIYGTPDDIRICESIYNVLSLNMLAEHKVKLANARERKTDKFHSSSWSSSFFHGYCVAIDERMREAKQATINDMSSSAGTSIEVIVRDKQHAIEEYFQSLQRTPTKTHSVSSSAPGYSAGHASGRNADIGQKKLRKK